MSVNAWVKIVNGRVVTPGGILSQGQIIVTEGKIAEVTERNVELPADAEVFDAEGCYVAPGCIDMHVHGAAGHDFSEATPEAFRAIARAHALRGTTALYPTIAADSVEVFRRAIRTCEAVMTEPAGDGACILGLHLEGNYLNPAMKGAQHPDHIYPPKPEEYHELLEGTTCIKRWSAAPELPGALEFGRYASERGVVVSVAHTTADYPAVRRAWEAGFTHATHFYNAMTAVHKEGVYKYEGTVEGIYLTEGMTVEVIADGIHVPPAILQLVCRIKGTERVALVTDAMSEACSEGEKEGICRRDSRLMIEEGVCKLADGSAIAGSIATGIRLIRTMVREAGCSLSEAVRMAAETPARIMGISERKGAIRRGMDADLIVFDDDFALRRTMVGGRWVRK
ncbi:N-acetylglucosamine-6-phosphate deacetylase [uncultured Rikenella sp.]|uniref:N-acetylglucosamine-6-phosphate deacetylase n=1 Tax=uncultured Rikenella sp. TaxID=368003 RepID=UPI0025DB8BDB|nr:N-acetylglucosamine-6-phosphate deacetylase [uncultured Rikenella sp.]